MILVTGASGFVGLHLVRTLSAQGSTVRALYHMHEPSAADKQLKGVEWQKADLLDVYDVAEVMKGVTDVYHCAAIVSFDPELHERMLFFNAESTANVVNEALIQGVRRLVYMSSIAALGRPEAAEKEITEEEQWGESKYNSAYGLSKYMAETEVWRAIGEGLDAVILNPGIILGEGDWSKGSAGLMNIAWKEFPFYTKGVTAWVDVQDVVRLLTTIMDTDITAERFVVSAGNYSFREIFTMMAASLNRKPPRFFANNLMTGIIWRLSKVMTLAGRRVTITRETANNANALSYYSNKKLLNTLPEFSYTPIQHTIERMAKAFVQRQAGK